ncbi:putative gag-polypeptide of LTR copia-type [Rosa chinensis]|uniref:Putative gag-polypeptide of LTR copia-type n=1 Tax=Rosa chinensis TaxID=74649 RepID=A0A2P6PJN8_ROSCH|nr:putative gag-polypeptide of LTR copia-type [Rosa chinensis]
MTQSGGSTSTHTTVYLLNILLDETNYPAWLFRTESFLRSQNLFGFVDGTIPCPPQTVLASDGTTSQCSHQLIMPTFYDPEEEAKIFLRLTILRENKKVLFAGANKDFVDNLLGLMTFPVSSMIPFIPEAFGSLTNVRKSIENMAKYHNPMKELLLNTKPPAHRNCKNRGAHINHR